MAETFRQQLKAFVESGKSELKLGAMMPIRDIEAAFKDIGFDDLELSGNETNGWQIDFWYKFYSKKHGIYTLAGSLHYGDFKITKGD